MPWLGELDLKAGTGLHMGEVAALQREDVDFSTATLSVTGTMASDGMSCQQEGGKGAVITIFSRRCTSPTGPSPAL